MDRAEELWNSLLTPLPKNDLAGALQDPFERAAYRTRQGARPSGGRQEGAVSEALSDPAFLFNASPLGMTRDALTAANAGEYGRAASTMAPLAMPFAGPVARGAGALMRANPGTTGLAAGLTGYLSSADAADRDPKSTEWWRTPREQSTAQRFVEPTLTPEEERRYTAPEIQGFSQLGPRGKMESTARRDAMQKTLLQDRERALAEKIKRARADYDETNQQAQAAHEAEQSRLDAEDEKYRLANQSFRENHPGLTTALPFIGAGVAGAIPYGARLAARGMNNSLAQQLIDAVSRARPALGADAVTRAAARGEMKAGLGPGGVGRLVNEKPSTGASAAAMGTGAGLSAEGALLPYEIDAGSLPSDSHGREESNDPASWLMRAATGAGAGLLGASVGLKAPMMRGQILAPVSEMEGLLAGLKAPAARAPAAAKRSSRAKPKKSEPTESLEP